MALNLYYVPARAVVAKSSGEDLVINLDHVVSARYERGDEGQPAKVGLTMSSFEARFMAEQGAGYSDVITVQGAVAGALWEHLKSLAVNTPAGGWKRAAAAEVGDG